MFGGTAAGEAATRHVHSSEVQTRRFDAIVAGVPGRSDTSLAAAVERSGARLLLAGDAVAPRTAHARVPRGRRRGAGRVKQASPRR